MKYLIDKFEPQKYQLKLDIDKWAETIHGRAIITGVVKVDKIQLNAVDTKIVQVQMADVDLPFKYLEQDGIVEIEMPQKGEQTFEIKFESKLQHSLEGAYISTYQHQGEEQRLVVTQFESHFARKCFPCVDEPAVKAVFELEITQPDPEDLVLSNSPVRAKQGNTTIFESTPRMSTYLLAFIIGKLQKKTITNKNGVKITSYCVLNQNAKMLDFANDIAARSLEYYDKQFKTPYPLAKLDQVALPDFDAGAMENWGLVTYRESCMLADDTSSHGTRQHVASVIAHELSHQWFGNLVTPKWWDELWLNESFANAIEYYAVDAIHPEYKIWDGFWTSDCWAALRRDALPGVQAVQQPVDHPDEIQALFDPCIVYAKGAHLMLMLIRLMGEDNFFAGIRDYFVAFAYQNTTGPDLWGKLQPYADFDVRQFMEAWILQPGYPVITEGKQQRFLLDNTTDNSQWPLPHITDDMTGHYILNLSKAELTQKLAHFDQLSLEQQLRILADRILLSKTDLVESVSLFEIIEKCAKQTNSSVWEMIMTAIGALRVFGEPDDELNEKMKKHVGELVAPKIAQITLVPEKNEPLNTTRYRDSLLGLAYYAKLPEVMQQLSALYDDDFSKIHPELLDFVVGAQIELHENEYFDQFVERYSKESNPEFKIALLAAITEAKQPENIAKLIDILHQPKIVRSQDHLHFYLYLRRNRKSREQALDWLIHNWDYVCEMNGQRGTDGYVRYTANTIYTDAEAKKYYAFFDQFKDQISLSRTLKVAHADIDSRLELLAKDSQGIDSYLAYLK